MTKVASLWSRLGNVASLVATPLLPSHYISLVRPLAATHTRRARVEAVHDEVPGVRTLTLRPGRGWRTHLAGQHVSVGLAIDGRIATRTYSISSSPDRRDGCIAITVKAHPDGRVSRALVHDVEVGAFVTIGLPEGDFVIDDARLPSLFITAGSGITPVASMLRAFAFRDAVHIHYARGEMIFGDELHALEYPGYRLVAITSSQRFTTERLDELVSDWRTRETWACGPQSLLDAVTASFVTANRSHALHVERFRAALAPVPANAIGGKVRFAASAVEAVADGRTPLLRVAETAGLLPPHGCRMGICHTCDATMTAGCVRDLRTGSTIDEPGARIQICVCAAAGDVELTL
ncbi:MAG TPA: ferredoxin reductase [Kofleriaceae bacterium]|jgi:ferredoxin-NADP reductase|nr:ferredoxin reductase [Kofleriaceae bacterium]